MTLNTSLLLATTGLLSIYALKLASRRIQWVKQRRRLLRWAREIRALVHQHLHELRAKRDLLIEDKGYGVVDESAWQEEVVAFVRLVLIGARRRRFRSVAAESEFVRFCAGFVEHTLDSSGGNDASIDEGKYVEGLRPRAKGDELVQWIFTFGFIGISALLFADKSWVPAALAFLTGTLLSPPVYRSLTRDAQWLRRYGLRWIAALALGLLSSIASGIQDEHRRVQREQAAAEQQRLAELENDRKTRQLREAYEYAQKRQAEEAQRTFIQEREATLQQLASAVEQGRFDDAEVIVKQFATVSDPELAKLREKYNAERAANDKRAAEEKARLAEEEAERARQENYARRIPSYAIDKYTAAGYPTLVAKYSSRLPEIERMRRQAAEMAVDSGKCDIVENVQLSDRSRLKSLVFFLDCKNQSRFFLTEAQIRDGHIAKTEAEKAWQHEDAVMECRSMVRSRAAIPSSVDFHTFTGTSVRTAPYTANVVVRINYDASNAFGAEIGYTAQCIFPPEKSGEIEIFLR